MKFKDKIILALILVIFSVTIGTTAVRYILKTGDVVYFDLITKKGVSSMAGTGLSGTDDQLEYDSSLIYDKTEVDLLLDDKADTPHNHDDRYYTETETDNLLNTKAGIADDETITGLWSFDTMRLIPKSIANSPANPQEGHFWWDSTVADSGLKLYFGGTWRKVSLE